jgi:hypothetical protein
MPKQPCIGRDKTRRVPDQRQIATIFDLRFGNGANRDLHNPNVTFSKFSGSIGHPLAALDPATFLRAAQIPY